MKVENRHETERTKRVGCVRKVLKVSKLDKSEKATEYQEKLESEWKAGKEREIGNMEEELQLFGKAVVWCT